MTKAYSYIRFSTPEQRKGNSLERQLEMSRQYAEEHGLELDTELGMQDLGVSAFRGKNIEQGALGAFINAVKNGEVERGAYLLVESLDRISRNEVFDALMLFLSLLDDGIVIVTLGDMRKYDKASVSENAFELLISITIMSRAHEESKMKSQRRKDSWNRAKKDAEKKILTQMSPKWVDANADKTGFVLDEDRAETIRKIYEWSSSGLGTGQIVKQLESEGVRPWGQSKGVKTGRHPKRWYGSYINRILHNRAVLGEYEITYANGDTKTIYDYFPRVIDDDLFYRVQQLRSSRNVKKTGKGAGRKGDLITNIFSGIIYCGYSLDGSAGLQMYRCDGNNESMTALNKGQPYRYLQCSRIKNGNSGCDLCRKKYWRLDHFELSFLSHVRELDASILVGKSGDQEGVIDRLRKELDAKNGQMDYLEEELQKFLKAAEEHDRIPDILIRKANDLEDEKRNLEEQVEQLKAELKTLSHNKNTALSKRSELIDVIQKMRDLDGDELRGFRLRLSDLLKRFVDRVEVYNSGVIITEEHIDKVRKVAGNSGTIGVKVLKDFFDTNKLPYFIVSYKSGEDRIVVPDPSNPEKLIYSGKSDTMGSVESTLDDPQNGFWDQVEKLTEKIKEGHAS